MLYSNSHKLALSGWLKSHNEHTYAKSLKLQKFLFLYEAFIKAQGGKPDFSHLRGYERGPVFSTVYGDYTKERDEFDREAICQYQAAPDSIDNSNAQKAMFIVSTLSERELSELTHRFNIWNAQSARILNNEKQVDLLERDFGEFDKRLANTLNMMYPLDMISESSIISIGQKYFVLDKRDISLLTEHHYDVLSTLSEDNTLHNPVFVTLDEEGRLIVD